MLASLISLHDNFNKKSPHAILTVYIKHIKPPANMPIEMPQIKKLVDSKSAPLTMTKPVKKFEEKLTEELASINIQKDVSPSAPQQNNANQTTILAAEKVNDQAATTTTTVTPPELSAQNKPQKSESANIQKLHGEYGILLVQEISKYKQYPVFARQNRQQGLVILEIRMNDLGQLASVKVYRSSNHAALDKQAIEMVNKASPLSPPVNGLLGNELSILVPISFHLN